MTVTDDDTLNPAIEERLREDPTLAALLDRHGPLTVEPASDPFRRLCVSIINQQLSTASAAAIRDRTFEVLDDEVTPDRVLAANVDDLRTAGLSGTKVEYLRSAASAFRDDDLSRERLMALPDEDVVSELTAIRGVGEWTAHMFLIFVLGREDVLPLGDLAVRRGIEQVYADGDEMSRSTMRDVAESWRPYRSYGTRYIWAEYEG